MNMITDWSFVCPRCKGELQQTSDNFRCDPCTATYPILLGIPDFRIAPDPWIGIADDRAKGLLLAEKSRNMDLHGTVAAYWEMTPNTPREQAERFISHTMQAERRSREWLALQLQKYPKLHSSKRGAGAPLQWLDIGCGTADFAAAVGKIAHVVSADIAFRWLVVARKRLQLANLPVQLLCCNAEALPFKSETFDATIALGTIEHIEDKPAALNECRRTLRHGGALHMRSVNRYSLLPEPHVNVFGVGYLPRTLANRWVEFRTGGPYLHHSPVGAARLQSLLAGAQFCSIDITASKPITYDREQLENKGLGWLLPLYERSISTRPFSAIAKAFAPMLDVYAVAP